MDGVVLRSARLASRCIVIRHDDKSHFKPLYVTKNGFMVARERYYVREAVGRLT